MFALLPVAISETGIDGEDAGAALKSGDIHMSAVVLNDDELPSTNCRGARDINLEFFHNFMHKVLGFPNYNTR